MKHRPVNMMHWRQVVAPHAGAWIETVGVLNLEATDRSPPTRGRGLKQHVRYVQDERNCRPPRGGVD